MAAAPPETGERVRIVNQLTETHWIRDLAEKVLALTGTPVAYLDNPRKKAGENDLVVRNGTLLRLSLSPIKLDHGLITEIAEIAQRYRNRIDTVKSPCVSRW